MRLQGTFVIFLVKLQGIFQIDHSGVKGFRLCFTVLLFHVNVQCGVLSTFVRQYNIGLVVYHCVGYGQRPKFSYLVVCCFFGGSFKLQFQLWKRAFPPHQKDLAERSNHNEESKAKQQSRDSSFHVVSSRFSVLTLLYSTVKALKAYVNCTVISNINSSPFKAT